MPEDTLGTTPEVLNVLDTSLPELASQRERDDFARGLRLMAGLLKHVEAKSQSGILEGSTR